MALFNGNSQNSNEIETIIGPSVKVEGNFKGDGNINIEGMVQGSIKTNHNLTVGSSAKIKAEVDANNLFLAGEIKGNVRIKEKTTLTSSARIIGNLDTKILTVEEGALINGKCTMMPENEVAPEQKKTTK